MSLFVFNSSMAEGMSVILSQLSPISSYPSPPPPPIYFAQLCSVRRRLRGGLGMAKDKKEIEYNVILLPLRCRHVICGWGMVRWERGSIAYSEEFRRAEIADR